MKVVRLHDTTKYGKQYCDIPPGTVFEFGSGIAGPYLKLQTVENNIHRCVNLSSGYFMAPFSAPLLNYVEYPNAEIHTN